MASNVAVLSSNTSQMKKEEEEGLFSVIKEWNNCIAHCWRVQRLPLGEMIAQGGMTILRMDLTIPHWHRAETMQMLCQFPVVLLAAS